MPVLVLAMINLNTKFEMLALPISKIWWSLNI